MEFPPVGFVDIHGYEQNYMINKDGVVYSKSHYNFLKQFKHARTNRQFYRLALMGKVSTHYIDDLIESHFISEKNDDEPPTVEIITD
jgi:hypothetical protein